MKDEPLPLTFEELASILKGAKRAIGCCALAFAALFMVGALLRPIQYTAEGTFREKGIKQTGLSSSVTLTQLLSNSNGGGEGSEATSLMFSRTILGQVSDELHLQGTLETMNDVESPFSRVKANILLTWGALTRSKALPLDDPCCALAFLALEYTGEIPLVLRLDYLEGDAYEVSELSPQKKKLGKGEFSRSFQTENLSFTIVPTENPPLSPGQPFLMTVDTRAETAKAMAKKLTIEPNKLDKTLLTISYRDKNRHTASAVVNALMERYRRYSKEYHAGVAKEQLDYLNSRRDQLTGKLVSVMEKHADYLSNDLFGSGFTESSKEMDFLAKSKHDYQRKLLDNELEIQWLSQIKPDQLASDEIGLHTGPDHSIIHRLATEIHALKQQKAALELDIKKMSSQTLEENGNEYRGITLEVATDLFRDFSKQVVSLENSIRQNLFFIRQIEDPHFEITSLSAGLTDPVSTEIIHKASQLVLHLRDAGNQSEREQSRIRDELQLQRTFLTLHLEQTVRLLELHKQLIDKKLFALQNMSLEIVVQRLSLLEKNLQETLYSRTRNLEQEKALIKRQLEGINGEMALLPNKWVSEQLLSQEVTINHLIVEEIAKLVETKNISHNLEVLQSAPLDAAYSPVHPASPHLFLLTLLGACIGGLLGAAFAIMRKLGDKPC